MDAKAEFQHGNFVEAGNIYSQIIKFDPENKDAQHNLAVTYISQGNVKESLNCIAKAISIDSGNINFWLTFIDAKLKLGELTEVEKVFEMLSSNSIKNSYLVYAHNYLGKMKEINFLLDDGSNFNVFDKLLWVLRNDPNNLYARDKFLEVLKELKKSDNKNQSSNSLKIFGLGTGRSGSTSLSSLLSSISNSYASHEHDPLIKWAGDFKTVEWHLQRMEKLKSLYNIVCDVAHWWLPYTNFILEREPNAKFVCIRRAKIKTIESFLKIKGGGMTGSINHWTRHDGSYFQKNIWDLSYPKYQESNLEKCLEYYWEDYYQEAERYQIQHPNNFKIFELEDLNTSERRSELYSFLNISDWNDVQLQKKNKGGTAEGSSLAPNPFVNY